MEITGIFVGAGVAVLVVTFGMAIAMIHAFYRTVEPGEALVIKMVKRTHVSFFGALALT